MAVLAMRTSRHVLVVDDEAEQLETLCRGLLHLGFVCVPARTAAEALARLAGPKGGRIDLLIADLSSPGKPGARLIEQVRNVRPKLPVLVVTGLAFSPKLIALGKRGVPMLRKPFTPEQLGLAIQKVLAVHNGSKGEAT